MRPLSVVSLALLLASIASYGSVLGPGRYNGVVIFDRWDGCHLYTGVFQLEISETVKEALRPYQGKAILIDVQEVFQRRNPGDGLITKLQVLGQAENTVPLHFAPSHAVDGLSLRAIPSFSEQGPNQLVIELRNLGKSRREIDTRALAPTLLTKRKGLDCFSSADGPSFPVLTRLSVSLMQQGPIHNSCQVNGKEIAAGASITPGFAISQKFELDSGQGIEIPIRFELSAGEYEFLAGYEGSYEGPALASNVVDFDVDNSGQPHLTSSSVALNHVRPPLRMGAACGRVTLESGDPAAQASVYLWSLPFPKEQPRAANVATAGEDGFFRLEEVMEGRYIVSAIRRDAIGISLGAFGGNRPLDAVPVWLPDPSGGCSLPLTVHPQPTYTVRGRTQKAGRGRTARMILRSGDAFPFESTAVVQPDGRYEFRNVPAGRYQFFAGRTGAGFDVDGDIENVDINIKWPDRPSTATTGRAMPREFNETMAILELKALDQAVRTYARTYNKGFARNLEVLGPPPEWYRATADHAGLLRKIGTPFLGEQDPTHFTEQGYRFTYSSGEPDTTRKVTHYTVSARPSQYGKTGKRNFFMDESGVIHTTSADTSATKDHPVVNENR